MDTKNLKPLISALDDGYRYRPHQMLDYFLSATMSLWGLPEWQPVPRDVQPQITEAIEVYADIVAAQTPFMDVLGPLYMELSSRGAKAQLGQYFTPWALAVMMAKISAVGPLPERPGLIRICDPASGSGVMMLAFAHEILTSHGPEGLLRLSVTGCDLDHYCARMFAVQAVANCNVHNLQLGECVIYRGNSLAPWEDLDVIIHATSPSANESPALSPGRLAALSKAAQCHPDVVQREFSAA